MFSARNNAFQKVFFIVFHKRNIVNVTFDLHYQYFLIRIFFLIMVRQNI